MSTGTLQIFSRSADDGIPVPGVTARVRPVSAEGTSRNITTDASGYADPVHLWAPDRSYSLDENNTSVLPYAVYNLTVEQEGYYPITINGIQVFAGENAMVDLNMIPVEQNSRFRSLPEVFTIPEHSLFAEDGGSGEQPSVLCERVLTEVVIPNKIVVHLGTPASTARNVTVLFRDYIKNVASSEIYPTWPVEALRANIYAQISLALNRIYTEWYRSKGKGYDFDITNSTSYDQYYVHGRNIFESISKQVDEIFNTFIRKGGAQEPYFSSYCDGKSVTCSGMKQWGSKDLADEGYTALRILRYYYGNDISLETTDNIQDVPESYPGTPLRRGSTGDAVRIIQRQLNRITKNYPGLGTITNIDGVFGQDTETVVKNFQKQFSLTVDGVVGRATWYKISYIYVSVKKLAELTSEGEFPDGQPSSGVYPGSPLQQGSTGASVRQIQFWLSTISGYVPSVPDVAVDGIFGASTTAAVRAYQEHAGLTVDGIVGRATWDSLYNDYQSIESDISSPDTSFPGQYPGTPLRRGSTGNSVRQVQFWLSVLSDFYSAIPAVTADGVFGAATETGVRAFQRGFSLTVDGVVGPATWNKLYEVYTSQINGILEKNELPGVYPGTPLRVGSTGIKVKEAQFYLYLMSAYYPSIPRISYDGIFGTATRDAVIAFQQLSGLTADGVIGPATWQALYSGYQKLRTVDGPVIAYHFAPYPGYPVSENTEGQAVEFVQFMLAVGELFYPSLREVEITGFYGEETALAVTAFQREFSLPETGTVDEETWNALLEMLFDLLSETGGTAEEEDTDGGYPGYVLTVGSAGQAVQELQFYINAIASLYCAAGFVRSDGYFDEQTRQAVLAFQAGFGLPETGFVDQATWEVLYDYYLTLTGRATAKTKIFVYDEYENRLYVYYRAESEAMPYSYGTTLRVREFRGSSKSPTLWTTVRAMESWNQTRRSYGSGIPVGYAFKRIWEGGHGTTSQHYAGVAFDVGQTLSSTQRRRIWQAATNLGVWGYVEPLSMTPTWVHFDRRYGKPACGGTSGYPTVRRGDRSTYVLILQDALNALGYSTKTLDGIFGVNTESALRAFQRSNGLTADGICGCNSWRRIASAAVDIGRTSTVID